MKNLPKIISATVNVKSAYTKNLVLKLNNGETIELNSHSSSLVKAKAKAKDAVGKTLGFEAIYCEDEIHTYYSIGSELNKEESIEACFKEEMSSLEEKMKALVNAKKIA